MMQIVLIVVVIAVAFFCGGIVKSFGSYMNDLHRGRLVGQGEKHPIDWESKSTRGDEKH